MGGPHPLFVTRLGPGPVTYTRLPGADSTPMRYDSQPMPMTRVEAWPSVGQRTLVFFDDPNDPAVERWRICSRILSITRLPSDPLSPVPGATGER